MNRRITIIIAAALAAAGAGVAYAQDAAADLRATGQVGEQADGYMGLVGAGDAALRARVNDVNIKRRASYTDLAAKRGAKIEEVAAATACEIFSSRVRDGQYYRLPGGAWQKKAGAIALPSYCG